MLRFLPKKNIVFNIFLWLFKIKFRINFKEGLIYYKQLRIHFSYLKRNSFFTKGIQERLDQLIDEYLIKNITLKTNDLIIDCGANIGEFTLAVNHIAPNLNFVCIEPEKKEFSILKKNLSHLNSINLNIALSNKIGEATFFKKNINGDSSLFYFEGSKKTKVQTITLDSIFEKYQLKSCKILKLEAEGAEPEILEGANNVLKKIKFITVDCGPERGISQEKTITSVSNILYSNNFELIEIHQRRNVLLFKNKINLPK